jgi:hypothetical protein
MRESPSSVLSEPRVGLDCNLLFFLLFLHFRIFVVVFVSAPASASLCSLSLSLFHYYLSVSLSISLSSLRISPRASLLKSRDRCKADSILRSSREVSHPSTNSRRNKFVLEFSWQIFHKLCFIIQLIRFGNIKLQKMFF